MVLGAVYLLLHVNVFTEQQVDDENIVELRTLFGITFCEGMKGEKKVFVRELLIKYVILYDNRVATDKSFVRKCY